MDLELFRVAVEGDGVGGVGLQLDGVGASLFRFLDDLQRGFQLAVMVGGKLGDDVRGCVGSDAAAGNADAGSVRHAVVSQLFACHSGASRPKQTTSW
ncbi:hypothetical protein D3C78_1058670 [compost metagenome]